MINDEVSTRDINVNKVVWSPLIKSTIVSLLLQKVFCRAVMIPFDHISASILDTDLYKVSHVYFYYCSQGSESIILTNNPVIVGRDILCVNQYLILLLYLSVYNATSSFSGNASGTICVYKNLLTFFMFTLGCHSIFQLRL